VRPLHIAAALGDSAMIEFLLQEGADAALETNDGVSPAQIAERKGFTEQKKRLDDAASSSLRAVNAKLVRFGYINEGHLSDPIRRREEIRTFQKAIAHPPSGVLNESTLSAIYNTAYLRYGYFGEYRTGVLSGLLTGYGRFAGALDALKEATKHCQEKGTQCRIVLVPAGACAVAAFTEHVGPYISEPRLSSSEAAEEAIGLCRAERAEVCEQKATVCG
jgi:hypothetical protein